MMTEPDIARSARDVAIHSKRSPAYRQWIHEVAVPMREQLAPGKPVSEFRGELLERFVDGSIRCLVEETSLRANQQSRYAR
ncbi:hypothetical protein L907_18525 [Agrobacterium sp. C13]|nr:hypothetical protein K538_07035 [Agrobacterium tumefaciens GW4]KVK49495.1 hypothetical protein L903_19430 [Agrobacterium sp. JL28]KVK49732.1 hypothetical protein L904_19420 [Agrobacterium sp. LY4]KVK67124.1 hypothetical protein L907_18525 [Agrobacterium sp. C13]